MVTTTGRRLLTDREMPEMTGLCRSGPYNAIRRGTFPQPVRGAAAGARRSAGGTRTRSRRRCGRGRTS